MGDYLSPVSWKCTMTWSAYMGLPLSLEGAGKVLGLSEQKLKEGKDLIRYFCVPCKPTKVNGGRTRNLPEHQWIFYVSVLFCFFNTFYYMGCFQRLAQNPGNDFSGI